MPRSVTRPVSIVILVAWVASMAVLVNKSYLHATSANLATDLVNMTGNVAEGLSPQLLVLFANLIEQHASALDDLGESELARSLYRAAVPIFDRHGAGEVVGGAKTAPAAVERAIAFYASIGKKPIQLHKEMPGHVGNRLQAALYREVMYLIEQGVLSVTDADDAVSWGPGLRWGVMGPSLQWHVGGGAGGIQHFMEHLMDPLAAMFKSLGNPEVTPQLKQRIADGVLKEAADRSVEQLAQQENETLLGLLRLRAQHA